MQQRLHAPSAALVPSQVPVELVQGVGQAAAAGAAVGAVAAAGGPGGPGIMAGQLQLVLLLQYVALADPQTGLCQHGSPAAAAL